MRNNYPYFHLVISCFVNVFIYLYGGFFILQKELRLKKREDFKKVYTYGRSVSNRELVLYMMDQPKAEPYRFGISVSKKVGNAVIRNRVKRLIKEAIRSLLLKYEIKKKKDYIIIARIPAAQMDLPHFERSLKHLFKKMKIIETND